MNTKVVYVPVHLPCLVDFVARLIKKYSSMFDYIQGICKEYLESMSNTPGLHLA